MRILITPASRFLDSASHALWIGSFWISALLTPRSARSFASSLDRCMVWIVSLSDHTRTSDLSHTHTSAFAGFAPSRLFLVCASFGSPRAPLDLLDPHLPGSRCLHAHTSLSFWITLTLRFLAHTHLDLHAAACTRTHAPGSHSRICWIWIVHKFISRIYVFLLFLVHGWIVCGSRMVSRFLSSRPHSLTWIARSFRSLVFWISRIVHRITQKENGSCSFLRIAFVSPLLRITLPHSPGSLAFRTWISHHLSHVSLCTSLSVTLGLVRYLHLPFFARASVVQPRSLSRISGLFCARTVYLVFVLPRLGLRCRTGSWIVCGSVRCTHTLDRLHCTDHSFSVCAFHARHLSFCTCLTLRFVPPGSTLPHWFPRTHGLRILDHTHAHSFRSHWLHSRVRTAHRYLHWILSGSASFAFSRFLWISVYSRLFGLYLTLPHAFCLVRSPLPAHFSRCWITPS